MYQHKICVKFLCKVQLLAWSFCPKNDSLNGGGKQDSYSREWRCSADIQCPMSLDGFLRYLRLAHQQHLQLCDSQVRQTRACDAELKNIKESCQIICTHSRRGPLSVCVFVQCCTINFLKLTIPIRSAVEEHCIAALTAPLEVLLMSTQSNVCTAVSLTSHCAQQA